MPEEWRRQRVPQHRQLQGLCFPRSGNTGVVELSTREELAKAKLDQSEGLGKGGKGRKRGFFSDLEEGLLEALQRDECHDPPKECACEDRLVAPHHSAVHLQSHLGKLSRGIIRKQAGGQEAMR